MHLHSSVIGHHPHDLVCHSRTLRQYRTWSLVTRGHRPGQHFSPAGNIRRLSLPSAKSRCYRRPAGHQWTHHGPLSLIIGYRPISFRVTSDSFRVFGNLATGYHRSPPVWLAITSGIFPKIGKIFRTAIEYPMTVIGTLPLSFPYHSYSPSHVWSRVRSLELRVIGCQPITTHSFA
jgi:hypothetical protein